MTCPTCAIELPPRGELPDFAAEVLAERARLALLDPEGEREAVAPLDGVKARQILLHLAEPEALPLRNGNAFAQWQSARLDQRVILERLGADLARQSGMVHCPGPLHPRGDRNKSLSWRWTGEKALLRCFVGCDFDSIRAAL